LLPPTPTGRLLFDLLVAGRPMNYLTWQAEEGSAVLVRVSEDGPRARLVRKIIVFRRRGRRYARRDETHVLFVPSRADVLAALRGAGFRARAYRGYGAMRLLPRRTAFLAQTPDTHPWRLRPVALPRAVSRRASRLRRDGPG
jgi:hypothetical protein